MGNIYYSYCVILSVLASWRIDINVIYPSHSLFDKSPTWPDYTSVKLKKSPKIYSINKIPVKQKYDNVSEAWKQ